jgi:hypothetical protein
MRNRSLLGALLLSCLLVPLTSCSTSPALTSITIIPTSINFGGGGLSLQLIATGYYTRPGHLTITKDITDQVSWVTAAAGCVTVSNTGLIISGFDTCSNIPVTASAPGFHGYISAYMTVNVTQPTTTGAVTSLSISRSAQKYGAVQFTAMGVTADGTRAKLSGQPVWQSTDNMVATIDKSTGVLETIGAGRTTISAVYTNPDGTTAAGVTHFDVAPEN